MKPFRGFYDWTDTGVSGTHQLRSEDHEKKNIGIAAGGGPVGAPGGLRDKSRKVLEICEVGQCERGKIGMYPLFQFCEEREQEGKIIGSLKRTDHKLINEDKCAKAGVQI